MGSIEQAILLIEELISEKTGKYLSSIQKIILKEIICSSCKNYAQIAIENNYSETYIKHLAAPQLWQLISSICGEKVNKSNCRHFIEQLIDKNYLNQPTRHTKETLDKIDLEIPEGEVALTSPFYIEREIELTCYQEIMKPGAYIRIKAPYKMGKTSLMRRILVHANYQNFHTVELSLSDAETDILISTSKFLRWWCANITLQLGLESKLEDYWDDEIGTLISCRIYFESYILQQISSPVILALDETNQIFEYPSIARDFLSLLSTLHEKSKNVSVFEKLHLLIINSTDIYIDLDTNISAFNVGLIIELPPFTKLQVEDLAKRHKLQPTDKELEKLIELTGGLPYLIGLALYHSANHQITIENLLQDAVSKTGIYRKHLDEILWYLKKNPDLTDAFQQVINANISVYLEQEVAFKLNSLGLVHLEGSQTIVSCGLYREYFRNYYSI